MAFTVALISCILPTDAPTCVHTSNNQHLGHLTPGFNHLGCTGLERGAHAVANLKISISAYGTADFHVLSFGLVVRLFPSSNRDVSPAVFGPTA